MKLLWQSRAGSRALVCALFAAQAISCHAATAPAADFEVSHAQMQSLGVKVQRLKKPAPIDGAAYPAKVVLPPSQEQVVSAPIDGVVDRLLVSGQEPVKKGQVLVRLVSRDYGERQLRLLEATDKARLSQKTLAREKALFEEGIIAERRVQEAESTARMDAARMRQAQTELRFLGVDPAAITRAADGGRIDDVLAIRAKSDGLVIGVDAKPGQRVRESDSLVRIADPKELWLDIQIPSNRVAPKAGEIRVVGRDVIAAPQSVGALVGDGQMLTLRARVTSGAQSLRPGEVVQAQVPFADQQGWALPLSAITRQDGKAYVFVRSPKGFSATPVNVVASSEQAVQVTGNLRSDQDVAVTSVIALKAAWLGKGGGE
ncbi:RND family efflux transporter MFP subunit [Caballeronia novacaledonica]|uniref:RND family efflux transporter MFP subunit n=1 Tax=Caballeronia novacaledonica TaxID=1544861 RepID=A0A2U3I1X9_9BURK|nr:efflux RND transporter periplasmic adaptor subunit [Caballeronia novacaledonica]SPB14126.1 RND family efflux transporter MFP subunit [Caballeronia novacaledonica]